MREVLLSLRDLAVILAILIAGVSLMAVSDRLLHLNKAEPTVKSHKIMAAHIYNPSGSLKQVVIPIDARHPNFPDVPLVAVLELK